MSSAVAWPCATRACGGAPAQPSILSSMDAATVRGCAPGGSSMRLRLLVLAILVAASPAESVTIEVIGANGASGIPGVPGAPNGGPGGAGANANAVAASA